MKRLLVLIIVWTLLVVTGTLVSADGQTRKQPQVEPVPSHWSQEMHSMIVNS